MRGQRNRRVRCGSATGILSLADRRADAGQSLFNVNRAVPTTSDCAKPAATMPSDRISPARTLAIVPGGDEAGNDRHRDHVVHNDPEGRRGDALLGIQNRRCHGNQAGDRDIGERQAQELHRRRAARGGNGKSRHDHGDQLRRENDAGQNDQRQHNKKGQRHADGETARAVDAVRVARGDP